MSPEEQIAHKRADTYYDLMEQVQQYCTQDFLCHTDEYIALALENQFLVIVFLRNLRENPKSKLEN